MFESLSEKLENIFKKLKGRGILNEENVNASLKEIRMALLEADVNFKVAKDFIEDVRTRAIGKEVLDSITPGQQIVKIVHDRLVDLMGGVSANIKFGARVPVRNHAYRFAGMRQNNNSRKVGPFIIKRTKKDLPGIG